MTTKTPKTILIIGISSFVGANLAEYFKNHYRVIGTYCNNPVKIPGILTMKCDVLNSDEIQFAIYKTRPDITIYAAGLSSIIDCHENEHLAEALNTSGLFSATDFCMRYKSQIIYLSSFNVFSGDEKTYLEMDIPDPNTVYGKTQASGEFYVQKTSLNYLIFRTCRLYGRGMDFKKRNWFELIEKRLKLNINTACDDYIKTGFLDIYFLAALLHMCIEKGVLNRLFHVSSSDMGSIYEFAKKYSNEFGFAEQLLARSKWEIPILSDTGLGDKKEKMAYKMDVTNLEGFLNIEMPSIEDSLKFTHKRFNGAEEKGSKKNKGDGIIFI